MQLEGKNILIIGLAKTGVSLAKFLYKNNANILISDSKKENELTENISMLKDINAKYFLAEPIKFDFKKIDLAIVSPGVPLDIDIIKQLKENKVDLIGEIEFAYKLTEAVFVGITGTNGKTTTTTLVGEIFKEFTKTFVVGNIGNPVIDHVESSDSQTVFVSELSSFQLESIVDFKPRVAAILNITPDHLNRHKTMENYIEAKSNIFKNQDGLDFTIFNYDCKISRNLASKTNANIIFFSHNEEIEAGVYVKDGKIISDVSGNKIEVMNVDDIKIPGVHNLENILAAIAISSAFDLDLKKVSDIIKSFEGVEHRLEFVRDKNGVVFVNDSKGTNPDASIKALNSYNKPIVLIAGGMDKKSEFDEFIDAFDEKVKAMILIGETSEKLEKTALSKGFKNSFKVKDMNQAVALADKIAKSGDIVLLSPACASWDMYSSYEVRGEDFKNNVLNL